MKRRTLTKVALAGFAGMLFAGGSSLLADSKLKGKVAIDGSSTVYPITEAVAEEFGKKFTRVRVTVGISGTGGGFKRFVKGETDISDASRPIKAKEDKAAKEAGINYIEIPVAYDGLSIVVNKSNTWAKDITVDELKKMFLDANKDSVKTWKDIRSSWPATPIKMFIPGTDSGTFDYFKEVIAGKTGSIRSDVSVSEDDNVLVRGIAGNEGAIGFFGCAYYFANKDKIRAVAIDGGKGAILPSPETIENGTYAPFSRPLFIYVNAAKVNEKPVDEFVKFYFEKGPELAEEVGYVRLPSKIYDIAKMKYAKRITGTHFTDEKGEAKHGPLPSIYK